ncbi:MAG: DNA polymerase III subunit delta' [Alphaproteobacteria bacterium]|nr:DNA polymerase III subunit delta' [Alphaproteobacteria bacterium]MDX5370331.1 DNA polymerase III subunit delta' [Alphaproteobacteria bacterium]MDX5464869.1 DNA polymerase III subunit delta' [Alphaproteobacteria bacterium]
MSDDTQQDSDCRPGAPHPRDRFGLRGHDRAVEVFLSSWASGRLPHAWLIGGEEGVGKATMAYHLIRALLRHGDRAPGAVADVTQAPPDEIARRIAAGGHGNLIVLRRPWDDKKKRAQTVLPVAEVRRLGGFLSQTASEKGWRIVLVDGANDMNTSAANALLKSLEEPPRKTLFFLISDRPGALLPTIRSRCARLDLQPLSPADTRAVLAEIGMAGEGEGDLDAAVALSGGSPGQAVSLMTGGVLGVYRDLLRLLADGDPSRTQREALASALTAKGGEADLDTLVGALGLLLPQVARTAACGAVPGDVPVFAHDLVAREAGRRSLDAWPAVWEKTVDIAGEARAYNLDPYQTALHILDDFLDPGGAA